MLFKEKLLTIGCRVEGRRNFTTFSFIWIRSLSIDPSSPQQREVCMRQKPSPTIRITEELHNVRSLLLPSNFKNKVWLPAWQPSPRLQNRAKIAGKIQLLFLHYRR
jgi:hypothetical protein